MAELISVVMPVLNAGSMLKCQLESLAHQTYKGSWELVIADNGSTDHSLLLARQWAGRVPSLRIVDASSRRGINHARNLGAAAARGDFLVFCDADDVATPEWLERMAEAAEDCDLVGGALDEVSLNERDIRAWRFPLFAKGELPRFLNFLPYAVGCNLGLKASVFKSLGGWNERYAGGGDDIELCWRAQLASYRLCFAPKAIMTYRYRSTLRGLARQFYKYGCAGPQLYRDFREQGVQRESIREGLRRWCWLAARAPRLISSRDGRGLWVRIASYRLGLIRGSIRHRIILL